MGANDIIYVSLHCVRLGFFLSFFLSFYLIFYFIIIIIILFLHFGNLQGTIISEEKERIA